MIFFILVKYKVTNILIILFFNLSVCYITSLNKNFFLAEDYSRIVFLFYFVT